MSTIDIGKLQLVLNSSISNTNSINLPSKKIQKSFNEGMAIAQKYPPPNDIDWEDVFRRIILPLANSDTPSKNDVSKVLKLLPMFDSVDIIDTDKEEGIIFTILGAMLVGGMMGWIAHDIYTGP